MIEPIAVVMGQQAPTDGTVTNSPLTLEGDSSSNNNGDNINSNDEEEITSHSISIVSMGSRALGVYPLSLLDSSFNVQEKVTDLPNSVYLTTSLTKQQSLCINLTSVLVPLATPSTNSSGLSTISDSNRFRQSSCSLPLLGKRNRPTCTTLSRKQSRLSPPTENNDKQIISTAGEEVSFILLQAPRETPPPHSTTGVTIYSSPGEVVVGGHTSTDGGMLPFELNTTPPSSPKPVALACHEKKVSDNILGLDGKNSEDIAEDSEDPFFNIDSSPPAIDSSSPCCCYYEEEDVGDYLNLGDDLENYLLLTIEPKPLIETRPYITPQLLQYLTNDNTGMVNANSSALYTLPIATPLLKGTPGAISSSPSLRKRSKNSISTHCILNQGHLASALPPVSRQHNAVESSELESSLLNKRSLSQHVDKTDATITGCIPLTKKRSLITRRDQPTTYDPLTWHTGQVDKPSANVPDPRRRFKGRLLSSKTTHPRAPADMNMAAPTSESPPYVRSATPLSHNTPDVESSASTRPERHRTSKAKAINALKRLIKEAPLNAYRIPSIQDCPGVETSVAPSTFQEAGLGLFLTGGRLAKEGSIPPGTIIAEYGGTHFTTSVDIARIHSPDYRSDYLWGGINPHTGVYTIVDAADPLSGYGHYINEGFDLANTEVVFGSDNKLYVSTITTINLNEEFSMSYGGPFWLDPTRWRTLSPATKQAVLAYYKCSPPLDPSNNLVDMQSGHLPNNDGRQPVTLRYIPTITADSALLWYLNF